MSGTIVNGKNIPLNQIGGSVPDVSGALQSYYQKMVFTLITKSVLNFQVVETPSNINIHGTIQPFSARQLQLKPEGQRAWTWYTLHATAATTLKVDDVVIYLGTQYRIMAQTNFSLYGYMLYEMIEDYVGAGPL